MTLSYTTSTAPTVLASLLLSGIVLSQASSPAPGFRLYGPMNGTDTYLVDTAGAIVHTWPSAFPPGLGVYLLEDGSILRAIKLSGTAGGGGGVQRIAFDGTLLWDYRYDTPSGRSHHDIEPMPNGNVLLTAWEEIPASQAIAAGRDPALLSGPVFRSDHIVEVRPTGPTSGTIVWEWHVLDHVVQDFDRTVANYGIVSQHPELVDINFPRDVETSDDWNHVNGIDYDPVHDRIVISAHAQDEIWVIDHSTTSAEAAGNSGGRWGRGGDILYRWGNPIACRAGTAADQQLFGQHAPNFVPPGYPGAGNIVLFNNNFQRGASAVFELELPLDAAGNFVLGGNGRYGPTAPLWTYTAPGFASTFISSAERLPNGNTLVCSGGQRWLFEVAPAGQVVWQHTDPAGFIFHTHYTPDTLWARDASISAANGGMAGFHLLSGSAYAGGGYHLLASLSGTSPGIDLFGLVLPLNPDPILLFTLTRPNAAPLLNQTAGVLSPVGGAHAHIRTTPGYVPASLIGVPLSFAFLTHDPADGSPTRTSNPVTVLIVP